MRTFCDHQVFAVAAGLARCRRAAAASSPGPDRIEDRAAGMGGTGRVSGVSASGHGLIGRGIVVPFQLRPAGRGEPLAARAGSRLLRGAAGIREVLAMAVYRSRGTTGRAAR